MYIYSEGIGVALNTDAIKSLSIEDFLPTEKMPYRAILYANWFDGESYMIPVKYFKAHGDAEIALELILQAIERGQRLYVIRRDGDDPGYDPEDYVEPLTITE